jgi:hypothetical protein
MVDKKAPGSGDPQPQEQKVIDPMTLAQAQASYEASQRAALQAALQAAGVTIPQAPPTRGALRINARATNRRMRRNLQDPFVWLKSPGKIILGVASKWMFDDNAKTRKLKMRKGQVMRLRCSHYEDDPLIYFWVTDPNDGDGYDVLLVNGHFEVNIADWMFEEGIAPEPGISQKFDLVEAEEQMLGGPALCINTSQARKTKYFDTTGKKDDEDETAEGE